MKKLVIGMIAHVDAGKTTLSEALLYHAGTIRNMGRVDNRDSFLDFREAEREHGITIWMKQAHFTYQNMSVTLLDTPGHVDFSAETERTLSVLDYAVIVINGMDGVQSHTETLWSLLSHYQVPTIVFVNKMDQNGTDEQALIRGLKDKLSDNIVNMTHPDYEDLSLLDDALLTEYLTSGTIRESLFPDLIRERRMFPCFFGSALKDKGITDFMDSLTNLTKMPDYPEEFGAKVFKITYDKDGTRLSHLKITGGVLQAKQIIADDQKVDRIRICSGDRFTVVSSVSAGDICAVTGLLGSRIGTAYGSAITNGESILEPVLSYRLLPLNMDTVQVLPFIRILEDEDPTLHVVFEETTGEIFLQLMGSIQLEIIKRELLSRFKAEVSFDIGSIVYKETIADTVEGVGHFEPLRHYAEVHLKMEPLPLGSGIIIDSELSEDELAHNWQNLVLKHLSEKRHRGVLTGSVLTDVKLTLVAGKSHPKHTEGGDFRQATYRAVRQGLMMAENVLLEPVYTFSITLPEECLGRVMHDLECMYASFERVQDASKGIAVINGRAPVSAFLDYPAELPAATKGLGRITFHSDGYQVCHNTEEVLLKRDYNPEADLRNPCGSVFCSNGSGFPVAWNEVYQYMHLPLKTSEHTNLEEAILPTPATASSLIDTLDISLGTEEIDSILHQASNANVNMHKKAPTKKPESKPYHGTENRQNNAISYLLVDGYNIIHAWPELASLASLNMDAARSKLLDTLCNYRAFTSAEIIVVFDAYLVKGHDTEYYDFNNIHVVFTKEAETADSYIERFTHTHATKYNIRVATSDGMEQIIIRGAGSYVISAREFLEEVTQTEHAIREML